MLVLLMTMNNFWQHQCWQLVRMFGCKQQKSFLGAADSKLICDVIFEICSVGKILAFDSVSTFSSLIYQLVCVASLCVVFTWQNCLFGISGDGTWQCCSGWMLFVQHVLRNYQGFFLLCLEFSTVLYVLHLHVSECFLCMCDPWFPRLISKFPRQIWQPEPLQQMPIRNDKDIQRPSELWLWSVKYKRANCVTLL